MVEKRLFTDLKLDSNEIGLYTDETGEEYLVFHCPKGTGNKTIKEWVKAISCSMIEQERDRHLDNLFPRQDGAIGGQS